MSSQIPFYKQEVFNDYFKELSSLSDRDVDFDELSWSYLSDLCLKVLTFAEVDKNESAVDSIRMLYDKLEYLRFADAPVETDFIELNEIIRDQIIGFKILLNGETYAFNTTFNSIVSDEYLEHNLDGTFRDCVTTSIDLEQMKSFMNECRVVMNTWDSLIDLISPGPINLEVAQELYRSIHNLKGVASFFSNFAIVYVKICHETESFFQRVIDGRISKLNDSQIDCILRIHDILKILFNNLDRFIQGREPYYENLNLPKSLASIRLLTLSQKVSSEDILPVSLNHLAFGESVRVSVMQLEELIETVQRIKLNTNELLGKYQGENNLEKDLRFLENSVLRMQDQIQDMRLFPIGLLFESFSKQVYDLQKQLKKSVNLEFRGTETKVDSTVADSVLTPLIHLVRNAMDHGIETREERQKLGKTVYGKITISVTCRGNEILFEVSDDGRGIDEDNIRKIAIEKGLDSSLKLKEILCSPGFTSKRHISDISGRGAGMDAVAAEVERIGGYLEIESILNKGCTVRLVLPLDFYSDDFLLIQSNQLNYLIPVNSVLKVFRTQEGFSSEIRNLFRIKNNTEKIPSVSLTKILEHPVDNDMVSLLVESNVKNRLVIKVPKIIGKQAVVVRPFRNPFLQRNRIISSAATLKNGMLAGVLDVDTLFAYAE